MVANNTPTVFSDDKLQKLKNDLGKHIVIDLIQDDGLRLLERLRAAEKVCKDVEPMVDHYDLKSWYKWRKMAGKE